jgi:hypothetical protein
MEKETVFTAHIGETDVYEWVQGIGKSILMPILMVVCKEVIEEKVEEKIAAKVQFSLKGKPKVYDFIVKYDGVSDTLEKIMNWAIEEEEYEMCSKIKSIQEMLHDKQETRMGIG